MWKVIHAETGDTDLALFKSVIWEHFSVADDPLTTIVFRSFVHAQPLRSERLWLGFASASTRNAPLWCYAISRATAATRSALGSARSWKRCTCWQTYCSRRHTRYCQQPMVTLTGRAAVLSTAPLPQSPIPSAAQRCGTRQTASLRCGVLVCIPHKTNRQTEDSRSSAVPVSLCFAFDCR